MGINADVGGRNEMGINADRGGKNEVRQVNTDAKFTRSFMNKKKGAVHMRDYEKIFSEALHAELKKSIIGGINVYITEYDELCVKIIRSKDLGFIFTYLSEDTFSHMIIHGYSAKAACHDVLESYKLFIMDKCFK